MMRHIVLHWKSRVNSPASERLPLRLSISTDSRTNPYLLQRGSSGLSVILFFLWRCGPTRAMASSFLRFLDHTKRRITVGRTPLDEWSARRRDPYLTTHSAHNRQTPMPPVGFEPTISAGERPQSYALDRAATGTGECNHVFSYDVL